VKNRFGATDEIGVFEMTGKGLAGSRQSVGAVSGRPQIGGPGHSGIRRAGRHASLLCEIQALVGACAYGNPRRAVVGWDTGRLAMILAVLDARAGVGIGASDVYLNVAGGLKISEPAADLAAAAALVSSFGGEPLPRDSVFFGEISLSGDIRPVPQARCPAEGSRQAGVQNSVRSRRNQGASPRSFVNGNYQCCGFAEICPRASAPKIRWPC
jgi:DNA repair protein RadA/Sms